MLGDRIGRMKVCRSRSLEAVGVEEFSRGYYVVSGCEVLVWSGCENLKNSVRAL